MTVVLSSVTAALLEGSVRGAGGAGTGQVVHAEQCLYFSFNVLSSNHTICPAEKIHL